MAEHAKARAVRRWPLLLIGSPAAVAIWSGWVGLGGLCGFGIVHPLPGILPRVTLNTAITLPVGVEAYATFALGAWLAPSVPVAARRFAFWSAIGSLLLGMTGQVAYHLLAAAHAARAPAPVIVVVSCVPVVALGFGAALAHLLRAVPASASEQAPRHDLAEFASPLVAALAARIAPRPGAPAGGRASEPRPAADPAPVHDAGEPACVPPAVPESRQRSRAKASATPALRLARAKSVSMTAAELSRHVSAMLEAHGDVSQARVKADLHVGTDKAREALRIAKRSRLSVVAEAERAVAE